MTVYVSQLGMPGGIELLIMFLMMLLYVAVPVAIIVLVLRYVQSSPDDERIRELEREVAELRGRLEERDAGGRDDEQ